MGQLPVTTYNRPGGVGSLNRDEQHSTELSRAPWPIKGKTAVHGYMKYRYVLGCQRMPFDANAVNPNAPGASCTRQNPALSSRCTIPLYKRPDSEEDGSPM
jgi:hypothetical protein